MFLVSGVAALTLVSLLVGNLILAVVGYVFLAGVAFGASFVLWQLARSFTPSQEDIETAMAALNAMFGGISGDIE